MRPRPSEMLVGSFPFQSSVNLVSDAEQLANIRPVRAERRRVARPGAATLFRYQPASPSRLLHGGGQRLEAEVSLPQWHLSAGLLAPEGLQMDPVNTLGMAGEKRRGIAAAQVSVSGIHEEADQGGVGVFRQAVDFRVMVGELRVVIVIGEAQAVLPEQAPELLHLLRLFEQRAFFELALLREPPAAHHDTIGA